MLSASRCPWYLAAAVLLQTPTISCRGHRPRSTAQRSTTAREPENSSTLCSSWMTKLTRSFDGPQLPRRDEPVSRRTAAGCSYQWRTVLSRTMMTGVAVTRHAQGRTSADSEARNIFNPTGVVSSVIRLSVNTTPKCTDQCPLVTTGKGSNGQFIRSGRSPLNTRGPGADIDYGRITWGLVRAPSASARFRWPILAA